MRLKGRKERRERRKEGGNDMGKQAGRRPKWRIRDPNGANWEDI